MVNVFLTLSFKSQTVIVKNIFKPIIAKLFTLSRQTIWNVNALPRKAKT